ncbi:ferrochelatase [Nisaea sp.]|uniref:ferrochelatase n=1 Tax=Nisaea sp. TaxID=2024842 RepID=UPI0032972325
MALAPRQLPSDHPTLPAEKIGVLLLNLGTPDATDTKSIRRYLREFLSDERVIEVNPLLWQIILNLFILPTRPAKTGHAYEQIWIKETNESPLRLYTRNQSNKLADMFADKYPNVVVDWGMRYGNPSTESKIRELKDKGCERILLVALYPQYAASTTATAYDKAFEALMKLRWQPAVRSAPAYHDEPAYVDGLANSIETHLAGLDWTPDLLITSYHGLPERYFLNGDPYHCHCFKTTRLVREKLGWANDKMMVAFQSRFGKEEWLKPYLQDTVEDLPAKGVKNLAIICPGFSSDCVETLEEINIGIRETFAEAGGDNFTYIPCLNDSDDGMKAIEAVVTRELQGWI